MPVSTTPSAAGVADVSTETMRAVYEQVKTPHKYGVVLRAPGIIIDCPSVFRYAGKWRMFYIQWEQEIGYETHLADSDDLLHWEPRGKILSFRQDETWDKWQAGGTIQLVDHRWDGGTHEAQPFAGKYWMSYLGGARRGYETDPLAIGMAWSKMPDRPGEWTRLDNPVLAPADPDTRDFEKKTLYRSNIIWDRSETLGHPFVMFYNGKQEGPGIERIGMAMSQDMVHWSRYGARPVIDNHKGISGDPQVVRLGDLWVMFYFGHAWKPAAFDTFACSRDLVHWTKWEGPHLTEPSEPWDHKFAHKPWVLKHDGVVYHFYGAVGNENRVIGLATSKDLR
jgi:predicted GH43/DUF377 family glycosyl hydrolase